jgi:predicted RNA-binding Zn-ribbon protein involved in translation (DUF1610 family)
MEETLKKYGISKQLFLKVTEFVKLQVDLGMINTLTDQEQIAAEILIMASEGIKLKTSNDKCNLANINKSVVDIDFLDWYCPKCGKRVVIRTVINN